jgi:hypothetical protein
MAKSAPDRYSPLRVGRAQHPHDQRHTGRIVAHHGRGKDGFAVVAERQHHRAGLAHAGFVQAGAFQHAADHIDARRGHAVDHGAGLARIQQHLDHLLPDCAITGQHNRPGATDRHGHALDLLQVRVQAHHHQDGPGLHQGVRPFGGW